MKINYKKIASVLASTIMLGSTIAFAAATWDPLVKNGTPDAAIVVGSSAAASDLAAATELGAELEKSVTATTTGVSGEGDKYPLEKTSTKLHIGEGFLDVVSATVTDDKLPTLLAAGKYLDSNNDEFDFTQKITLANASVTMFDDNAYLDIDNNPTVGVMYNSGDLVLNYTLTMSDQPSTSNLEATDMPLMGKTYYVLDATNSSLTLLDSAEKVTLQETDTKTLMVGDKSYEASIAFIGTAGSDNVVKLTVNGQITNSLKTGQTYKLSDGSFVGIRDISLQNYAGGVKQVEFGIGSGKLLIDNGAEVQMNDNAISRLKGFISNSTDGKLNSLTLEWKADGKQFVAPNSELSMPGFSAVKLVWDGLVYPQQENIIVQKGGDSYMQLKNFPLKDGPATIDLVYTTDNVNITGVGKDANNILRTSSTSSLTFDADTDQYFVVSYNDGSDTESTLVRATNFVRNGANAEATIQSYKDGSWSNGVSKVVKNDSTSTVDIGSVTLSVDAIDRDARTVTVSTSTSGASFNKLYTDNGMQFYLPFINSTAQAVGGAVVTCANATWKVGQVGLVNVTNATGGQSVQCAGQNTWVLYYNETNKNGNIAGGDTSSLTIGFNAASTPQLEVSAVASDSGMKEVGDSKIYKGFMYSSAATELSWDKSGDQFSATVINHGDESAVKVYLAAPTVTTGGASSIKVVKDTEVDSVQSKNLVIVGGSCINTVAASFLGSATPLCGAAFSAQTQVGAGQYLIKVAASPVNSAKIAMLVAGYDAADTTAAVAKAKEGNTALVIGTNVVGPIAS